MIVKETGGIRVSLYRKVKDMKHTTLIFLLIILLLLPILGFAKERKVARVLEGFMPVLKERRPESEIVIQAHKGDQFPVRRVGEYWVEVFVPSEKTTGWLELGMENPKVEILTEADKTPIIMSIVYFLLFVIAVGLVIYLLRLYQEVKRKKALDNIGGQ
jgi:hypothetical protein